VAEENQGTNLKKGIDYPKISVAWATKRSTKKPAPPKKLAARV
jgi:hypothetical protein